MIRIVPLSNETLSDAISMIRKIFPYMSDQKNAKYNLTDSLIISPPGKHYWVTMNEEGSVVGITGYIQNNLSFAVIPVRRKKQRLDLEARLIALVAQCTDCKPSNSSKGCPDGWLGLHSPIQAI